MPNETKSKPKTTRISSCLPTGIFDKLVETLKSPFSLAPAGALDKGIMAKWILDSALSTINDKGYKQIMEKFIHEKELQEEFKEFFKKESGDIAELS